MPAYLDRVFSDDWYAGLPSAFRDLDTDGQLLGYLRVLGDYVGGVGLTQAVLEGEGFIRPITLSNGSIITLGDWLTVGDVVLDETTGGAVLPLDSPVTGLDPFNAAILVAISGDWLLRDVATLPTKWVAWVAQVMSVDLSPTPAVHWRDWIESPWSKLAGSLGAFDAVVPWHTLDSVPWTVEAVSQWEVEVTVSEEAITSSEEDLLAALEGVAAAGVGVTVTLI